MGPEGLYEKIVKVVKRKISGRYDRLVVFAGNGLTRIAAALAGIEDPSWLNWLEECRKLTKGHVPPIEYLRRLGYSPDRVFSLLIDACDGEEKSKFLKTLYNQVRGIPYSLAHKAILDAADAIITTNYDRLFEECDVRLCGAKWQEIDCLKEYGPDTPDERKRVIWKIHGTFPAQSELLGEARLAADSEVYKQVAFLDRDKFDARFDPVAREICSPGSVNTLVLVVGLGFGGEELIIHRIFQAVFSAAAHSAKGVFVIEHSDPLDPLYKLERNLISVLKVPRGLAASPEARALAIFACIEAFYLGRNERDRIRTLRSALVKPFEGHAADGTAWTMQLPIPINSRSDADVSYAEAQPLVYSVGASSWNRILGLEQGISQESSYRARAATWHPDAWHKLLASEGGTQKTRPLVSFEAGGQALTPVLVWDALSLPCGLCSQVGADVEGESVLDALSRTKWVEFENVNQLDKVPQRERKMRAFIKGRQQSVLVPSDKERGRTENLTSVSWYAVRTIFDCAWFPEFVASLAWMKRVGPPVLYFTKVGGEEALNELDRLVDYNPLTVFETGGLGDVVLENRVASRGGIIVGSALSALQWFALSTPEADLPNLTLMRDGKPDDKCWSGGFVCKATLGLGSLARSQARSKAARWQQHWRLEKEEKDDRGRLRQLYVLLRLLKDFPSPAFLMRGALSKARAYVVTLGEYGTISWHRDERNGWGRARWTRIPKVDLANIRNALGCGDVLRAGLIAALLCRARSQSNDALIDEHFETSLEWANWFGYWKVQFFSLNEYTAWIRRVCSEEDFDPPLQDCLRRHAPADAAVGRLGVRDIRTEDVVSNGKFHPQLTDAVKECERFLKDSEIWRTEVANWAKSRGLWME